jgi:formyltetrahydrofolate synthetase
LAAGADAAVVSSHWALGGQGAKALAEAVVAACESPSTFKFLYDVNLPIEEKIRVIAKEIYGADDIQLSELAQKQVETYTKQGYGNLPSASFRYHVPIHSGSHTMASLYGKDPVFVLSRSQVEMRSEW